MMTKEEELLAKRAEFKRSLTPEADSVRDHYSVDTRRHWKAPLTEEHTRIKCLAQFVLSRYPLDTPIVVVGGGTDAIQAEALEDVGFKDVRNSDVVPGPKVDFVWDIQKPAPECLGEPKLVIASEVLEHTFDTEAAFRHILGGPWSVIVTVPNDEFSLFGSKAYEYSECIFEHIRHFTFSSLLKSFGQWGRGFGLEVMGLSPEETHDDVTAMSVLHKLVSSYAEDLGLEKPKPWEAAYIIGQLYPLRLRGLLVHHRRPSPKVGGPDPKP